MHFKAELDGTYHVGFFKAKDLPTIVRMVKQSERWRAEEQAQSLEALELAAKELNAEETPKPEQSL